MPTLILIIFSIFILAFLLSELFYNFFYDPNSLRKYPSIQPLAGFTNLSYIYHLLTLPPNTFRSAALYHAHRHHPILRLGPHSLAFSALSSIRDIYGHATSCTKGDMYEVTRGGGHANILNTTDRDVHSMKRKRLAAAFAAKNLEKWEGKVRDKCERLIKQLDERCVDETETVRDDEKGEKSAGKVCIDLRWWTNLFTVEAIADIALSDHLGLLEAGDDVVEIDGMKNTSRKINYINALHGIGRAIAPIVWSKDGYKALKRASGWVKSSRQHWTNVSDFGSIVQYLVRKRLRRYKAAEPCDDFVTCLLEDKEGQALKLDFGEIVAEVSVFLDAGSDTTAIALTHVLYFLIKNPDKLARLRESLKGCGQFDIPPYDMVKQNVYLRACLDESLRLLPPVSAGQQRKTPSGGTMIAGEWIAGNTLVSTSAYVVHRDPLVFPNPEAFIPERWLGSDAKEMQKYFIPFSAGSRGCIGRNLTYLEQTMLLAALVRRYDFTLPNHSWEMQWEERFNLWPRSLPVTIRRRKHDS